MVNDLGLIGGASERPLLRALLTSLSLANWYAAAESGQLGLQKTRNILICM